MAEIKDFLAQRKHQGLLRSLKPAAWRKGNRIRFNGKEYIDFCSNDYLGLSSRPELIAEIKNAIDTFGTASCASRLLSGDLELHHELERKVAQFKGKEAALVFNSGYQANVGILSALYGKGDCIFSDRLNHASIIDGITLSQAEMFRFQHNDAAHLEDLLRKERGKYNKALIITESIFSMDGDRAPLKELVCLKEKYNCSLMVDEAHATGIFGDNGAGVVRQEGLEKKVELIMGTFSKALAGFGAYLAASGTIVEYLVNTCRSFVYSTALPPAVIAGNLKSIELVEKEPQRRERLLSLSGYFRAALKEKGFEVKGCSQIVPVIIGDTLKAAELASGLQEKGYWVLPIRPPTVPPAQARLRLSLTFYHDKDELEKFIDAIYELKV
jgi:8-amino-7-oxononanoate synthase